MPGCKSTALTYPGAACFEMLMRSQVPLLCDQLSSRRSLIVFAIAESGRCVQKFTRRDARKQHAVFGMHMHSQSRLPCLTRSNRSLALPDPLLPNLLPAVKADLVCDRRSSNFRAVRSWNLSCRPVRLRLRQITRSRPIQATARRERL